MPTNDADDGIVTTAIAKAELVRSPAYGAKQEKLRCSRRQAAMPCPHVRQEYCALGVTVQKSCAGLMRLLPLHTGLWFVGCTACNIEHGYRLVPVPPSVNRKMLQDLFDDPHKAEDRTEQPASFPYMN